MKQLKQPKDNTFLYNPILNKSNADISQNQFQSTSVNGNDNINNNLNQQEVASDFRTRTSLHHFIKKTSRDNYITGVQSGKFYLFTGFLYILLVFIIFGYAILLRTDSTASSSSIKNSGGTVIDRIYDGAGNDITNTVGLTFNERTSLLASEKKIATSQLSTTTLANIALVFAVVIFGILWILKWTRPIPYEFAFFIVAVWIVFGSLAKSECVCCASSSSSSLSSKSTILPNTIDKNGTIKPNSKLDEHDHSGGTYVLDAMNHWMHTSGLCNYLPLITTLHSIAIILMIALLYVVIHSEYDYFRTEKIARKKIKYGIVEKDTESMMLLTEANESSNGLTSLDIPWQKIVLILVVLILALIPFACNNAVEIAIENYFLRVILFLFIFLMRLVNSYSGRYILLKFSIAFNVLMQLPDKGYSIDPRISNPGLDNFDELDESSDDDEIDEDEQYGDLLASRKKRYLKRNNTPDATSSISSQLKTQIISQNISRLAFINIIIDALISSLVLIVCGWFLLIAIIQILYEFVILYNELEKYGTMSRELQSAYNRAQNQAVRITSKLNNNNATAPPIQSQKMQPILSPSVNANPNTILNKNGSISPRSASSIKIDYQIKNS